MLERQCLYKLYQKLSLQNRQMPEILFFKSTRNKFLGQSQIIHEETENRKIESILILTLQECKGLEYYHFSVKANL